MMVNKPVLPQQEHLLFVEDNKGRREVILRHPSYSIGRSPDCDIRLRSQFVSRYHATLHRRLREDGSSYYQIVDGDETGKPSVNGLMIDGRKVRTQDLRHGDEIIFGPQVFAIYQFRQRDKFPTMPTHDPFDITLIDPAMMLEEEEDTQLEDKKEK
jgi:pSer/pThr/pTyr-binding forkhead associated (FHA) protein